MPQFFVESKNINENRILITNNSDIKHIKTVLRSNIGDILQISDFSGFIYKAKIILFEQNSIETEIIEKIEAQNKLEKVQITLAQSVLKSAKQDVVIQKATELGVNTVIPLLTKNTVVKFDSEKDKKQKVEKWEKIVYESVKQCERGDFLKINPIIKLKELINFEDYDVKFVCAEKGAKTSIKSFLSTQNKENIKKILVIIGPEGGWDDSEIEFFKANNITSVTLGKLILRAETASIATISDIIYEYEL